LQALAFGPLSPFDRPRRRLQGNGRPSARQLLGKGSGREVRHVSHVNPEVSKVMVSEAVQPGCSAIAMEDLAHIRQRIQAGKRVRARPHRWAWREL
jgi:IS605 OrfB family transposase